MKSINRAEKNHYVDDDTDVIGIINIVLNFLVMFMPITLAKRVVSIILIVAGLPISRITEMTGLTERSVRPYGRVIREGNTRSLLELKEGRGLLFTAPKLAYTVVPHCLL